jgi:hypothetical protein
VSWLGFYTLSVKTVELGEAVAVTVDDPEEDDA